MGVIRDIVSNSEKPLACPFCGSEPRVSVSDGPLPCADVICQTLDCPASNITSFGAILLEVDEAIKKWNTRTPSSFQVDRECRREIEGRKDG